MVPFENYSKNFKKFCGGDENLTTVQSQLRSSKQFQRWRRSSNAPLDSVFVEVLTQNRNKDVATYLNISINVAIHIVC